MLLVLWRTMAVKKEEISMEPTTLNRVIAAINKKAGETVIGRLGDMQNVATKRYVTGVKKLDEAMGGGFPEGRMVELYGLPSSGKSLIAQLVIANAQKDGGECVYVDAEGSFDPKFAKLLGVDTDKLALVQMGIGEDIIDTIVQVLRAQPAVIVVDSVGAMITRDEFQESVEKVFMAPKARLMSKGLPKITAANKKTLIIFINQLRQVITTWGGGGTTTPGGMALGFYASVRVQIKKDKDMLYEGPKTGHDPIGQIVQFNITKNKTAPPHRTGSFKFFFDGGIQE